MDAEIFTKFECQQLTMQQAVLHHFPTVNVTYAFTNRSKEMLFSRESFELAKKSVERTCAPNYPTLLVLHPTIGLAELKLHEKEADWLKKNCPYFTDDYINYLRSYRFRPEVQLKMELHVTSKPESPIEEGYVTVDVTGLWVETILYEVPVMAILSEAFFLTVERGWSYDGQEGMSFN
jgi:nicotinate phosphoribosyltransferase